MLRIFVPSRLLVITSTTQVSPPSCLLFHSPPDVPDVSRPRCRAELLGHCFACWVETNLVLIGSLKLIDRNHRRACVRTRGTHPVHFFGGLRRVELRNRGDNRFFGLMRSIDHHLIPVKGDLALLDMLLRHFLPIDL